MDFPVFRALGPLVVGGAELPAAKPRTLLSVLLLRADQWVQTSFLRDTLWPEPAPRAAAANIKTYVWQLRTLLGAGRLLSQPGGYRLRVAAGELDLHRFGALAEQGLRCAQPARAEALTAEALTLWRGEPFPDLPAGLAGTERAWAAELRWKLMEQLASARLALGRTAVAVPMLRAMVTEEPLRERSWAMLITALEADQRRADALAAYREVYRLLDRELGVLPGPEVQAAHRRVLEVRAV